VPGLLPRASARQIHADLRGRIVRGELRPGETLSEGAIAERYGLSRTPVREVVWRLSEEGLLRVVPQVGSFVAPISIAAVKDSRFVREALECRAIEESAPAVTPAQVAALRASLAAQTEAIGASDIPRFFALDDAMHRTLMEIAGHPLVWPVISGAKAQLDRVRYLSLEEPDWPDMILGQHGELIDAVAAHDGAAARAVMQRHLRTVLAAIDRIALEHAEFFEGGNGGR
jgi:DNA-binding GntR family transcriptional regulator